MIFLQQIYKGKTDWWRWLIILIVFATPFFKNFLTESFLKQLLPSPFLPENKNTYIAIKLGVYAVLICAFYVAFKVLHQRDFKTLITSRNKIRWMRFGMGFATWGVFTMVLFSLSVFSTPQAFEWNFRLIPFLKYFFICIALIPFKAFFKPLLLRGYLLQLSTYFFKKPLIGLLVSIVFYTYYMYMGNSEFIKAVGYEILIYYVATAFFIGLIIILDQGMEIVLGMTLVSNLISALFVTSKSFQLQPDSILIKNEGINVFILVYVTVFLAYPMYLILLKKVYKWDDWKQKLYDKINPPV